MKDLEKLSVYEVPEKFKSEDRNDQGIASAWFSGSDTIQVEMGNEFMTPKYEDGSNSNSKSVNGFTVGHKDLELTSHMTGMVKPSSRTKDELLEEVIQARNGLN
jgi:hypothetical protein